MKYQILNGDNIEILKTLPDNSIDSIITDPPYGIAFLGKDWDHKKATETTTKIAQLHNLPSGMAMTTLADDLEFQSWLRERWIECLRVLKPGGHLLAFSAARTYHHMAMSLQTAGFEIRDQIMWIYSSGFPKSQDVGKSIERSEQKVKNKATKNKLANNDKIYFPDPENEWAGWGTALKPAHEPIALARKPMKLSIAKNCQKWGVGALNIDATRVPMEPGDKFDIRVYKDNQNNEKRDTELTDIEYGDYEIKQPAEGGRFPSNVIGEIAEPYQKYFYCPKVSRKERHIGCFDPGPMFERPRDENGKSVGEGESMWMDSKISGPKKIAEQPAGTNNHPTVKPIELMKYLIKLVTPPNGRVLDPFNGSGSTGMAAVELGHEYIGIEQDEKYCEISERRIAAHFKRVDPLRASGLFD